MHWVLGVVHGNSTYATYVKIQAGINGLVTVSQGASAFEIPEYGVELSCEVSATLLLATTEPFSDGQFVSLSTCCLLFCRY